MIPLPCLLAYRFLRGSQHNGSLSFMLKLCFLSMSISTCALILVLSIATGFEQATYTKLKGVHTDGIIRANGKPIHFDKIKKVIDDEFKDSIRAISPSNAYSVVTQDSYCEFGPVALLKGVDPLSLKHITIFPTTLIAQREKTEFTKLFTGNSVVIGAKIAEQLGLSLEDTITILFPEAGDQKASNISLGSFQLKIAGIAKTGIEEVDEQLILCSLDLLKDMFPESAITEIGFAYTNSKKAPATLQALRKRFQELEIYSWQDLYPPLVAALALEKYAITAIVILIMLVASMNIASLLLMYIHQKRKVFAICKIMGLSSRSVQLIIILMGIYIAASACLVGMSAAFFIGMFLKQYPIITLPDAYYVSSLPIELCPSFFIGTFFMAVSIGFFVSLIPAYMSTHLQIAATLKSEE